MEGGERRRRRGQERGQASGQVTARSRRGAVVALLLALACGQTAGWASGDAPPSPAVYGYLEKVDLPGVGLALKARLDTGATTSSVHAVEIETFEREGQTWVRFRLDHGDERGPLVERPVARWVRIKRKGAPPQRRPVVRLDLCLGDQLRRVEVSLSDRSDFLYPVLLGRNFLAGVALVDSSRRFTARPGCPAPDARGDGSKQ